MCLGHRPTDLATGCRTCRARTCPDSSDGDAASGGGGHGDGGGGNPDTDLEIPCKGGDLQVNLHLEKAMAPHFSTLAWKIPWMEEPGRLQSMGSLRIGHD